MYAGSMSNPQPQGHPVHAHRAALMTPERRIAAIAPTLGSDATNAALLVGAYPSVSRQYAAAYNGAGGIAHQLRSGTDEQASNAVENHAYLMGCAARGASPYGMNRHERRKLPAVTRKAAGKLRRVKHEAAQAGIAARRPAPVYA